MEFTVFLPCNHPSRVRLHTSSDRSHNTDTPFWLEISTVFELLLMATPFSFCCDVCIAWQLTFTWNTTVFSLVNVPFVGGFFSKTLCTSVHKYKNAATLSLLHSEESEANLKNTTLLESKWTWIGAKLLIGVSVCMYVLLNHALLYHVLSQCFFFF